jgi:hypothetical protein
MRQLAVLTVLAATALFGGLDTVDDSVTTFRPGEEFRDGEFTVVVERASLVGELRAGSRLLRPPAPGTQYLGVVATVRNDGTTSDGLRRKSYSRLRLTWLKGTPRSGACSRGKPRMRSPMMLRAISVVPPPSDAP